MIPPEFSEHKARLRAYFDGEGFERWRAIYGDAPLSRVRRSIREGHSRMLRQVLAWIDEQGLPPGAPVLDAGCGTGLLSVALAQRGFAVTAVDIAPQMVAAATQRAEQAGVHEQIRFVVSDLESISGQYAAVACLDVLIHYPEPEFAPLCIHLAQRSQGPLFFTHAPYNRLLASLHWLGGHFPRSQRRTDIQMIPAATVARMLAATGRTVQRTTMVSKGFYHVALVEAQPIP